MKKLTYILLYAGLFGLLSFISCNKNSDFEKEVTLENPTTMRSNLDTYYFVNSDIEVGDFDGDELILRTNLIGKTIYLDNNLELEITNIGSINTSAPNPKYLNLHANSINDINTQGYSYNIAVSITDIPNFLPTNGGKTHTCTSNGHCSQCDFKLDSRNCIIGCKCKSGWGGGCIHSVTKTETCCNEPTDDLLTLSIINYF